MAGTIEVYAAPPGIRRATGMFGVVVDGVRVGRVRHGGAARFQVAAGTHTVRVTAKDRTRSNTVTVEVIEGRELRITARGTGLAVAALLPVLAGIAVSLVYVLATVLLTGALFYAVPGLLFRVRVDDRGVPGTSPAADAVHALAAGSAREEDAAAGLWWESDPVLAKRFRKGADS